MAEPDAERGCRLERNGLASEVVAVGQRVDGGAVAVACGGRWTDLAGLSWLWPLVLSSCDGEACRAAAGVVVFLAGGCACMEMVLWRGSPVRICSSATSSSSLRRVLQDGEAGSSVKVDVTWCGMVVRIRRQEGCGSSSSWCGIWQGVVATGYGLGCRGGGP